jgi:hypothetical protein
MSADDVTTMTYLLKKDLTWNAVGKTKQTSSRYFQSYHTYYPYDPYLQREFNSCVGISVTTPLSGKDDKDRKHGVM